MYNSISDWPHENTIWADDAFMAVSFISRMGEVTGEKKYFDDAANQILNYTRYLWCPVPLRGIILSQTIKCLHNHNV